MNSYTNDANVVLQDNKYCFMFSWKGYFPESDYDHWVIGRLLRSIAKDTVIYLNEGHSIEAVRDMFEATPLALFVSWDYDLPDAYIEVSWADGEIE